LADGLLNRAVYDAIDDAIDRKCRKEDKQRRKGARR
jgi:hypothetical protein